jgi:hypothetical protein
MEHAPKLIKIDGEWQYVPLSAEEIAEREAFLAEQEALMEASRLEAQAKEQARLAGIQKLIDLGLTEEQAKALIS